MQKMDDSYLVKDIERLATPALVIYREKLEQNTRRAIDMAGSVHRLRPHVKTHKTSQVVALQMKAGISKFKCATIAEAEMLAQCGVPDILLAYPLVGPNVRRFAALCGKYPELDFKAVVDDEASARALSRELAGAVL